jgi:hypothetical protein
MSAVKNAGMAPRVMNVGTTTLSTSRPRRQAAIIPIPVPITNEIRKAKPTRKIEYGSVRPTTSDTGVG